MNNLCDEAANRWFAADFLDEIAMVGFDVHFSERVECGFTLGANVVLTDADHARTFEHRVVLAHGCEAFDVFSAK